MCGALRSYLVWPEEVEADVGVARGGIHTVMTEVLTDVLRCGLRQQAVNTLPVVRNETNHLLHLQLNRAFLS